MTATKPPLGAFENWPRQPCNKALLPEMNGACHGAIDLWEVFKGLPPEIFEILGMDAELPDRCGRRRAFLGCLPGRIYIHDDTPLGAESGLGMPLWSYFKGFFAADLKSPNLDMN